MKNPYFSLLGTAWHYAYHKRNRYLSVYAMFVVSNSIIATQPLLYGWFIQSLQNDSKGILSNVWIFACSYLVLVMVQRAFHGPARVLERKLAFEISQNFLDDISNKAFHLPIQWHQNNHSGITVNRIRKAYQALRDFFQSGFMFFQTFAKLIFSVIAILWFSPVFGIIGISIGILAIWVMFKFDKPFIKSLEELNEKEHEVSSTLSDIFSNIVTVITLRLESRMKSRLVEKIDDVYPIFSRSIIIEEWKWFVASIFISFIYVVITVGYIYQHYVPGQTFLLLGSLVTLLGYVNQFTSVFQDIAWQYTEITRYYTEVRTARVISELYKETNQKTAENSLDQHWQEIQINNLNYTPGGIYCNEKQIQSLNNINILIRRGKRIAIIGESGCGKSTLLALLRGLYQPMEGAKVVIDGKTENLGMCAEHVTLFPQNAEIFENTIAYNITLGLPFEENEIVTACDTAHLSDFIKMLPRGINSSIQENGVNLSGGQKQRITLARGVLAARSSHIVLLDEPTSSIDTKSESQIYEKIFSEFKGKAVISTLHRLHLLQKFDYVYMLQNGRIVDEGTFTTLQDSSKIFKDFCEYQNILTK